MRLYLSSYKIGKEPQKLVELFRHGKRVAYVSNALDFTGADLERRRKHIDADMNSMRELGFEIEELDLKNYFGRGDELRACMRKLDGLWISGGNTFVLLQAMRKSGLANVVQDLAKERNDFVYAGYSAAGCALSPTLHCYATVDNPMDFPYGGDTETNWAGLGILNFAFMPHYDSDHRESPLVDKEIKFCLENKILFKVFRDGEVLIADTIKDSVEARLGE